MSPIGDSSWTTIGGGTTGLLVNTTGDQQAPYPSTTTGSTVVPGEPLKVPGSSIGASPADYIASARAVYPTYDGVTLIGTDIQSLAIDPRTGEIDYSRYPATFWTNSSMTAPGTATDFANWHSSFQAEYIVLVSGTATTPAYTIGTSSDPSAIYMLDDKNRPVNLLSLTLSDYAKLSDSEKQRFNANLASSGRLATLGLSTSTDDKDDLIGVLTPAPGTGLSAHLVLIGSSSMTAAEEALFSKQIQMLIDEVDSSYAFNADKINAAANEVMARFKIADKFASAPRPATITITGTLEMQTGPFYEFEEQTVSSSTLVKSRVNTLDGGESMTNGLKEFLRAEAEILNMKERRQAITTNSAYRDPNLDVPNLIYQLQLLYEGEQKGVVDAGTEEFRQLHKLLEHYNVMQQLLSTTISAFDTAESDDKRRFMNIGVKDDGEVDETQYEFTPRNEDLEYTRTYIEKYGTTTWIDSDEHVPRYHWSVLAKYDPEDRLAKLHRDFVDDLDDDDNYTHEGDVEGKLSRTEMLAFSMFVDEPWANTSNRAHPIEDLYGAPRPKFDLIDQSEEGAGSLKLLSKNAFDQFQTALSNSITILNQQNQIKQNDVENATKQQNRHFELGNNALRKMNDLLLMIGRM